ncbi:Hypothetical_protein [Hexamita inflata]|uniref:Hypothetical_protein n=1 Tax=Hexamita inflata TaxID=28002 RepID=A0AA86QXZ4_9EUKA|nr:Hypothetical protein HINF_LOCUS49478 [Hexamita inflata]
MQAKNWIIKQIRLESTKISGFSSSGIISNIASNNGMIEDIRILSSDQQAYQQNQYVYIGSLIGYVTGYSTIQVNNIQVISSSIQGKSGTLASICGILVGEVASNSVFIVHNAYIKNSTITSISTKHNAYAGGIVGKVFSNAQLHNIENINISLNGRSDNTCLVGGVISYVTDDTNAVIIISQNTVSQVNLFSGSNQTSFSAGIIGLQAKTVLQLSNVSVINLSIIIQGQNLNAKLYINYISGTYSIQNMSASGNNFVNLVQLVNCPYNDINSINGC